MYKNYSDYKQNRKKLIFKNLESYPDNDINNNLSIAIIIPHRNRIEHLDKFIAHFKTLKISNNIDVYIIDQNNADKFNRGLLLNIGFIISKKIKLYDRFIFHDVDLYPDQTILDLYFKYIKNSIHYIIPKIEHKYSFGNYLGGVIGLSRETFEKINGFPNNFFGWGGEDDALYNRLSINNIEITRPINGSYILADHNPPTETEYNKNKQSNILQDIKDWKHNGLSELSNLFINIKKYDSYNDFISLYNTDNSNITNHSTMFNNYLENNLFNSISSNKVNYFFFKIDYLAEHTKIQDVILNKNYVDQKIQQKIKEFGNTKYFQHKINPIYISVIEPLITIEEINEKIFNTYTEPVCYEKNEKTMQSKSNLRIKKLVHHYFTKYNTKLTKNDLFKTIKFIFNTYNELLYFRIRNNKLECAYHLYNPENNVDWLKYIKYKKDNVDQNIDNNIIEIIEKMNKKYYTIRKPHFIPTNNCLLGLDSYNYIEGNPISYVQEFKDMLEFTIQEFKNVPDCDILINRKDFPYLRKDNKYAYNDILPVDKADISLPESDFPSNFWFLASQSVKNINLDIPIPTSNEWSDIDKYNDVVQLPWSSRIEKAFFRGGSTGCSIDINTNPRLHLAQISYEWNKNIDKQDLLDVAISTIVTRIKVYNQFIGVANFRQLQHLKGNFVDFNQQLSYKYIFNIQGNAQAYRYANEFKKGALILNVKSDYHMWFEPLIKPNKHYIEIDQNYINLLDTIKKIKKNDDESKQIALNGYNFSSKYINKKKIALFWLFYMTESNANICNKNNKN